MAIWSSSKKDTTSEPQQEDATTQVEPALLKAKKESEKVYRREVWWLEHRDKLKRGAIIFAIVLEVTLGLIGIWAFADYYLVDFVAERQLATSFIKGAGNLANANVSQKPIDLSVANVKTIQSGSRFDILTFVENSNVNWIARITFHFEYGEGSTPQQTVVVNQATTLALTELALEGSRARNVDIVVDNVKWMRISPHDISDPVMWKAERWNIEYENVTHLNDIKIGSKTFGRTTFDLANKTGYGFYDVPITLVLKRGSSIVGVNKTVVSQMPALSTTKVQVDWFDTTPNASKIEIYPEIDLFDDTMYIPTSASETLDIRDTETRGRR